MTTKTMITIRRPNGIEETLDVTAKYAGMNDILFARIRDDNRKAGRGECLRYEIISERSAAQIALGEVDRLQAIAESCQDDPSRFIPARKAAEEARIAWRAAYPAEAAADDRRYADEQEARRIRNADFVERASKLQD